ncbi:o-succinylbenzoate--CoA ligase [Corynebacterium amycolatum]|uniref:o-succinylbenzoate--CoA ligase n=1 Tax=Corynebacterium amycolatum TaxID=43765 RepID=UPI003EDF8950
MVWVVRTLSLLSVNPHDPTAILPDLRAALDGEVSLLPVPLHDGTRASILRNSQRAGEPIDESIALVVGTSGSTGTPKGAQLTVDNLVSSATATHQWLGGEGQWLLAMPAYHIAGLQVLIRSLLAGTDPVCVDVTDGFDVAAFADGAEALTGAGASDRAYTSLAPMQLAKAMEEPFGAAALRLFDAVLVGGAALNPQVAARAEELGINVVTTYGSSETAGGCVYDGHPIEGAQVAIENGRVWLGGPMIAHGYRNAPSHEAFHKPGWFATSDAGEIRDGRLVITGRLDTIIDSGGLKLHPEVLERELLAIDGVTGACVVGVPHPRLGQAIVAAYEGTADLGDVMDGLGDAEDAGRINHWMIPKDLRHVEALPLIGPGKVDRKKVTALF